MTGIAPDTIIDSRYKVLSRIGAGGMAEVFCAQDQSLGRKVALKLLYPRFASDEEFVERFRREASSAAGLQHPNVVGIYDRGRWDGTYYIAMEYLPGQTLKEVIREAAPLDPIRAIDLTVQILKAARFAHRRGIIHRDLKPHNVIVDDEDRAKVTDFGIARAGASDMTETGSIMGTAQYLSPEQAQGHAVSPQSDLYSVGIILFELLTGHVPFEADSAVSIALKHVSEPAPAPSVFEPSVPPQLDAIVLWALEKDPAHRPQDADAFIHALEEARAELLGGMRQGQATTMFAAAAAGGAAGALAGADPAHAEEQGTGEQPAQRAGRRPPWWVWALVALAVAGAALAAFLLTRPSEVTVPGVVGLEQQAAARRLDARGLESRVEYVTSDREVGEVVRQRPGARRTVEEGSTVTLFVSRGPDTVDVPSVEGLTVGKARAKLQNAGLNLGDVLERYDAEVPEGEVFRSSPAAGENIRRGSPVTVYVSRGPQPVTVPDVVGWSQADAEAELSNAGLSPSVTEEETTDVEAGQVISTDPAAGTALAPSSTVTVVVATAPPVEVPDVTGISDADATAALEAEDLVVRRSPVDVTDPAQDGIVLSQRPAPGTSVDAGNPVRIVIGRYTEPTVPPDQGGGGEEDGGGEDQFGDAVPGNGNGNGNGNAFGRRGRGRG